MTRVDIPGTIAGVPGVGHDEREAPMTEGTAG